MVVGDTLGYVARPCFAMATQGCQPPFVNNRQPDSAETNASVCSVSPDDELDCNIDRAGEKRSATALEPDQECVNEQNNVDKIKPLRVYMGKTDNTRADGI